MEDLGSVSSNKCVHCGRELPAADCDATGCQAVESATAAEPGACQKCGATEIPCAEPECPAVLAHEEITYVCHVCEREVAAGEMCDRPDCPRVAVEQIRKASIDTPFKLGL